MADGPADDGGQVAVLVGAGLAQALAVLRRDADDDLGHALCVSHHRLVPSGHGQSILPRCSHGISLSMLATT